MDSALGTGNSAPNLAHPLCFAGMHLILFFDSNSG